MKRFFLPVLAALTAAAIGFTAKAETMKGSKDPAFLQAIQLWLDDDPRGLRQVLDLANAEHTAATVLYYAIPSTERSIAGLRGIDENFFYDENTAGDRFAGLWRMARPDNPDALVRLYTIGERRAALGRLSGYNTFSITLPAKNHEAALALAALPMDGVDPALTLMGWMSTSFDEVFPAEARARWFQRMCAHNQVSKTPFDPVTMVCTVPPGGNWLAQFQALLGTRQDRILGSRI